MNPSQPRLELTIDVFEKHGQRVEIPPQTTARALITSILRQFRSLPYLSSTSANYALARADDRVVLNADAPLGEQIESQDRLILIEHEAPLPRETDRPSQHAYLRHDATGAVYKLHWSPAIVGRLDPTLPFNDRVAVDLTPLELSVRVSRRHAQIAEKDGRFSIQSLSANPTTIRDEQGRETKLTDQPVVLKPNQVVVLNHSQIALRFIVRDEIGLV